ncbi:unnamed protein product, partial [Symbiodinium sp. KB8]
SATLTVLAALLHHTPVTAYCFPINLLCMSMDLYGFSTSPCPAQVQLQAPRLRVCRPGSTVRLPPVFQIRPALRKQGSGGIAARRTASRSEVSTKEQLLEAWKLLPDGRFRGKLSSGVMVEFRGELVGPEDPGVVIGPKGVRYVLGEAAPTPAAPKEEAAGNDSLVKAAVAGAGAAVAAVVAYLVLPGMLQTSPVVSGSGSPVTRTNVTIVETKKTLPDGSTAKIVDRTVRRERNVPGKGPVVTERTTRTEKVVKDERSNRPALKQAGAS